MMEVRLMPLILKEVMTINKISIILSDLEQRAIIILKNLKVTKNQTAATVIENLVAVKVIEQFFN